MSNEIIKLEPAAISADWKTIDENIDNTLSLFSDMSQEIADTIELKELKRMRAELNRIDRELNDGRKKIKAAYNEPLKQFEAMVKERSERIQQPNEFIKNAISKKEDELRTEKRNKLFEHYKEIAPALVDMLPFEQLIDEKWLNQSVKLNKAYGELESKVVKVVEDWEKLKTATLFNKEQTEIEFFRTLDVGSALAFDADLREQHEKLKDLHEVVGDVEEPEPQQQPEKPLKFEEVVDDEPRECCVVEMMLTMKEIIYLKDFFAAKIWQVSPKDYHDAREVFGQIGVLK